VCPPALSRPLEDPVKARLTLFAAAASSLVAALGGVVWMK
jgi:hypothetical protein